MTSNQLRVPFWIRVSSDLATRFCWDRVSVSRSSPSLHEKLQWPCHRQRQGRQLPKVKDYPDPGRESRGSRCRRARRSRRARVRPPSCPLRSVGPARRRAVPSRDSSCSRSFHIETRIYTVVDLAVRDQHNGDGVEAPAASPVHSRHQGPCRLAGTATVPDPGGTPAGPPPRPPGPRGRPGGGGRREPDHRPRPGGPARPEARQPISAGEFDELAVGATSPPRTGRPTGAPRRRRRCSRRRMG
jgi:hypothetical protein